VSADDRSAVDRDEQALEAFESACPLDGSPGIKSLAIGYMLLDLRRDLAAERDRAGRAERERREAQSTATQWARAMAALQSERDLLRAEVIAWRTFNFEYHTEPMDAHAMSEGDHQVRHRRAGARLPIPGAAPVKRALGWLACLFGAHRWQEYQDYSTPDIFVPDFFTACSRCGRVRP